jgi:hypothetical protein
MLVLQTYVYLRDAESKSFYHESMTETLWEHVSALTLLAAPADGILPAASEPRSSTGRCSHCRNSSAHKLLNLLPTKHCCVFGALSQTDARKAAGDAVARHKERPGSEFRACCNAAITKIQEEE